MIKIKELLGWLRTRYPLQIIYKRLEKHTSYIQGATVILLIIFMLGVVPQRPPYLSPFEYEDAVEKTIIISKDYPLDSTVFYSDRVFLVNTERAIIEPEGTHHELEELLLQSPQNFTSQDRYTFILVDNATFYLRVFSESTFGNKSSRISEQVKVWIDTYSQTHDDMRVYYSSKNCTIYMIDRGY
jgi:hypothetical protein